MIQPYLLAFCRVVIALVFILSFAGKVRGFSAFEQTITNFKLIPNLFNRFTASMVLTGEVTVVASMIIGRQWLWPGFLLAALMLLIFCIALISVLIRRIRTSCNCFGESETPVTSYEIVRNISFILCTIGGCSIIMRDGSLTTLGWVEWSFTGLAAAEFVTVWVQFGDIANLFRQT